MKLEMIEIKKYKKVLADYVRLKSVSTDKNFTKNCIQTAEFLSDLFKTGGAKVKIIKSRNSNPVVLAQFFVDKKFETVLIYGHYDVQPASSEDGWSTEPFELAETKGLLIARGVVDNKGQTLIHILTAIELLKTKKLKYNIKFIIEGNEESGNPDLPSILNKYKKELASDYILISDGEILGKIPTLETTLRGGFNFTLKVKTGLTNVHSGLFGGAVPNAPQILSKWIHDLYDGKTGQISIPDFYKNAPEIKNIEKNKKIHPHSKVMQASKSFACLTEGNIDFLNQVGLRPTMQVTGINAGYVGEGYANIVPCEASVRINVRTVFPQKTKEIKKSITDYIKTTFPRYSKIELTFSEDYDPVSVEPSGSFVEKIKDLQKQIYKKDTFYKNVGGGIPVVLDMQRILKLDPILLSLGNDTCNMHGIDENFEIDLIQKGLKLSWRLFSNTD